MSYRIPLLLAVAVTLCGCSAGKLGSWFGGDSEKKEVAYVPPSTAAEPPESKVYQSGSIKSKPDQTTSEDKSQWGLDEIKTPTDAAVAPPVGDLGYVSGAPTIPQTTPAYPANGVYRGGNAAPRIYAPTFDGQTFDSQAHLGRVVLVDFWFRECGPCIRALPKVDALRKAYSKDQLTIIAVNHDRKKSTAVSYLQKNPHDWPQIYDRELQNSLVKAYGVTLFPTFVVIDQLGAVQYKGNSIDAASAKVAELVRAPSIPNATAPPGVIAVGPRSG